MYKIVLISITLLLGAALAAYAADNTSPLRLMPWPTSVSQAGGSGLVIDQTFSVSFEGYKEPRLERAAQRFLQRLSRQTGMPLPAPNAANTPAKFVVRCAGPGEAIQKVSEDESYKLTITAAGATLEAKEPLGILHGLQTFLQLVQVGPQGFSTPAVTIEDHPRFPWRGLMIDVSRHFMPVEVIERELDAMEAVKFNVLHWHLSDDQGFRVESKRFPKFQELSSDGEFYTQSQVREVIEYARERGIRVVPEFDMPGHTTSWFAAYPQLASGPGPYSIERQWGVFNPAIDPTRKETYKFLDELIGEMAQLFPDAYFHIGGDEVNGKQWDGNPEIQQFIRDHGLKNNAGLQTYFTEQLEKIVSKHGKRMMGWDEIFDPTLPKDIVIQSWRGQESLAEAAKQGYSGLLSNGYYLDLMQPASAHYLVDPLSGAAANLSSEEKSRILGGEACMWAEMITPENIDSRLWPRAAAVAERLWSSAEVRDLDSMYARLAAVNDNLQFLGITNRSNRQLMLQRMAGSDATRSLQILLEVLEPVKEYTRSDAGNYNSFTPLNRLVDAAPPESAKAREFEDMTERLLAAKSADATDEARMREWLRVWRENDRQLEPTLQGSYLLREDAPLSRDLEMVASIGLQALDYRADGGAPAGWRDAQLGLLKQAAEPKAELLNMIFPAIQKLVEAVPVH